MNAQQTVWTQVVLLFGLLVLSGCGPSKEQQAIDAYNRGVKHSEKGELDNAIGEYSEAIGLNPTLGDAYNNRGCAYSDKGEYDKAIADCTEAIRLNPKLPRAYTTRAGAYLDIGEYDRAIADSCEAIRLDPTVAMAYSNRGGAYGGKGNYDQEIADCSQAIRLDPNLALAYSNRGAAYGGKGQHDQEIADCSQAIRLDPNLPLPYYNRASAYYEKRQLDKAIDDYTEAIRLDPKYEQAWCNRGSVRLQKGQYDEALADYNQALQLDPNDSIALTQRFLAACNARLKRQRALPGKDRLDTDGTAQPRQPAKTPDDNDAEEQFPPPSARRVATRVLVLAAIVYRSYLEEHADNADAQQFRRQLLGWLDSVGLASELEQGEREFLETPLGKADQQTVIDGFWRSEGVAVLAWALKRYELPPYDQRVDLVTASDGVGFLDAKSAKALLSSAELRPSSEIDRLAAHVTIVHWRLRQYSLGPGAMNYAEYLRQHPASKPYWHDGLRFVKGDLAIGDKSVADAAHDEFEACRSTAVERQIAAYWLQGDREVYSEVDASTILAGL